VKSVLGAVLAAIIGLTAGGCASRIATINRDHLVVAPPGADLSYRDQLLAAALHR
jgi:hypothetical protein